MCTKVISGETSACITRWHEKYANSTELAKHVWSLKRSGTDYEITWKIKAPARSYNNNTRRCNLCTVEKLHTSKAEKQDTLNRRSEMISKCRHDRKYLLAYATTCRTFNPTWQTASSPQPQSIATLLCMH